MKFIHAADLHLDTPFQGVSGLSADWQQRLLTAPTRALSHLVDTALAEQVDFVLLVGDLFDQQGQSVQAQAALMRALTRLNAAQIPVLLSFGNHDYQPDLNRWHFPANVHVFGPQVTTVTLTTADQTRVAVSGFSYAQRWVATPMVAQYPARSSAVDYQIGMLHGQSGAAGDHYAPFNVGELLAKHYDYWALGHIHHRQSLNQQPPIVYPGNPQGRNRSESGPKGCLVVTSRDNQLVPRFQALTTLTWRDWTAPLTGELSRRELLEQLTAQLNAAYPSDAQLVTVTLPADLKLDDATTLALDQGALLHQLSERATDHWWPVALNQAQAADTATPLFGLDQATWQAAGKQVVTASAVAELAGHLLDEDFLSRALLEDLDAQQWQARVLRLLQDQYHLTTGGPQDVD
ncbi:metallophosphoesterase family protein [Lactiplantibacillus modestisalitolerans]|uniref:Exonuclease SbcCD subunit D n=1 Tax=Lactiplantibacillus modestisalitolerans TaxID=1457219 RepID=A0ABV5WWH0_9LACO|nr:DNA repair exonuclease [Lactiplantibacillus modestisalitolerans]